MESELKFVDYCPKCINYDTNIGVCSKIHLNVKDYPAKFQNKCAGEYFEKDQEKANVNESKVKQIKQSEEANILTSSGFSTFLNILGWLLVIFSIICLLDFILVRKLILIRSEVEGLILFVIGINSIGLSKVMNKLTD
ncbi:MAG: hypothetical protein PF638_05210 [Candidatus Delongbacteria bacterium]|jgi:hypothetical protein|nr:hypothetical protein [Candidatus Delongbacteria bacterium]